MGKYRQKYNRREFNFHKPPLQFLILAIFLQLTTELRRLTESGHILAADLNVVS